MGFSLRPLARLWYVALAVALAGALVGLLLGVASSFTSTATFRVNAQGNDGTRVTQQAQTASRLIDSGPVYASASSALGITSGVLRGATTVSWVTDTEIVQLSTSAGSAEEAQRRASAMAGAVLGATSAAGQQQYDDVRRSGNQALSDGTLTDPTAEAARRSAIGTATADLQNSALQNVSLLSLVAPPEPGSRAGLTPTAGVGMGFLAGAALGAVLCLTRGRTRMRVRQLDDLTLVQPAVEAHGDEAVVLCANAMLRTGSRTVAVLAVNGHSSPAADAVSSRLVAEFDRCGIGASVVVPSPRTQDAAATETFRRHPRSPGSAVVPTGGNRPSPYARDRVAILAGSGEPVDAVRASSRADFIYLVSGPNTATVGDFERLRRLIPASTRTHALLVDA